MKNKHQKLLSWCKAKERERFDAKWKDFIASDPDNKKDKVLYVPGGNNKLSRFLLKVLPQVVIYKMASLMMHKKE